MTKNSPLVNKNPISWRAIYKVILRNDGQMSTWIICKGKKQNQTINWLENHPSKSQILNIFNPLRIVKVNILIEIEHN
jgi:hypothetical protein